MSFSSIESIHGGTLGHGDEMALFVHLFWAEFVCWVVVVVFGLALWSRRRRPCTLLLPLAALLFAVSMLPVVLAGIPALEGSALAMHATQAIFNQFWLRPVGALLLAIYALMQWRGAGKDRGMTNAE